MQLIDDSQVGAFATPLAPPPMPLSSCRHACSATLALRASGQALWRWSYAKAIELDHLPAHASITQTFITHASTTPSVATASLTWRELLRRLHRDDRARLIRLLRHLARGESHHLDILLKSRDIHDTTSWRVRGEITERASNGRPLAAIGTWEMSDTNFSVDSVSHVKAHAFVASRDPMLIVDEHWRILDINCAFCTLSATEHDEILGNALHRFLEAEVLALTPVVAAQHARPLHHEGVFYDARGAQTPVELTLSHFLPTENGQTHYIAALRDISASKRSAQELEHLASIDTLTQLPNRATLQRTLQRKLARLAGQRSLALLFIDLDGFKHINDSLGHQAGDALLKVMVKRLHATVRSHDLLARWGGDEFVVVVDIEEEPELGDKIARRLLDALAQPMMIGGHQISVTASMGLVHAPRDGQDSETLLKHADVAMYAAKDRGKNAIVAYHEQLKHHNLEQMSMLSELRDTLANATLDFVVQPKFDGDSRIIGAELLARWTSREYGSVPPSTFVPLAEQNGMASTLGDLAIEAAARYAAELQAMGKPLPVAVNISALHVMQPDLAITLSEACKRHAITTQQIELEVTESVFLEDTRAPEARIEHLRSQGFRVTMDDFGAGYSSLGYLKRLPFDTIKIDRSFMHDLEADPRSRHLLAGIIGLCNLLGMEIVAEGVETREQWELLRELEVKQYQGFYLGRPMTMAQLIERLKA